MRSKTEDILILLDHRVYGRDIGKLSIFLGTIQDDGKYYEKKSQRKRMFTDSE